MNRCPHEPKHALGYCKKCYDRAWRSGLDNDSAYRMEVLVRSVKRGTERLLTRIIREETGWQS